MRRYLRFFSSMVLISLSSFAAFAQDASNGANDFSLYMGSLLPNQIEGVEEILPVFGGRYGLGLKTGVLEIGGLNSHAKGVDFTTFEAGYRYDVLLEEGLMALIGAGIDLNWYIPENETSRKLETGFHISTGGMLMVSNSFWLRGDLKLMGGPGTSLALLFGILIRDGGGGAN